MASHRFEQQVKFLLSKDINWEFTLVLFLVALPGMKWLPRVAVSPLTSFELKEAEEKEWGEGLVYAAGEESYC